MSSKGFDIHHLPKRTGIDNQVLRNLRTCLKINLKWSFDLFIFTPLFSTQLTFISIVNQEIVDHHPCLIIVKHLIARLEVLGRDDEFNFITLGVWWCNRQIHHNLHDYWPVLMHMYYRQFKVARSSIPSDARNLCSKDVGRKCERTSRLGNRRQ